jgi:PPP family 3-phenylpropionic acid transporter
MPLPQLTPEQLVKPPRFELRMSLIFFSLFISLGVHAPYFPLWLEFQGFDPGEIAVILSAPLFLRVITVPIITALADRAGDRAWVYIATVAAALLLSAGYFLPPSYALVLAVSLALQAVWTSHSPLADGLALSGVRRFGVHYANMRIWGSISFLCGNLAGGVILSRTGAGAVPVIITASLAFALVVAIFVPRLGRPRRATPLSVAELPRGSSLLTAYFVTFVLSAGVINASHGYMFAFLSIYWKSIGLNDTIIGLLWAFSVLAEVGMFMVFRRLFPSTGAPKLLVLAAFVGIIRWTAMPLIWPSGLGVPGFFAAQALHAFSTGLIILGVQKMIAETVTEERTGAAQGMAFFANGVAMAIVTLLSGPIYQSLGGDGFFIMTGVASAGLVLGALAWKWAPYPHNAASGGITSEPA